MQHKADGIADINEIHAIFIHQEQVHDANKQQAGNGFCNCEHRFAFTGEEIDVKSMIQPRRPLFEKVEPKPGHCFIPVDFPLEAVYEQRHHGCII